MRRLVNKPFQLRTTLSMSRPRNDSNRTQNFSGHYNYIIFKQGNVFSYMSNFHFSFLASFIKLGIKNNY